MAVNELPTVQDRNLQILVLMGDEFLRARAWAGWVPCAARLDDKLAAGQWVAFHMNRVAALRRLCQQRCISLPDSPTAMAVSDEAHDLFARSQDRESFQDWSALASASFAASTDRTQALIEALDPLYDAMVIEAMKRMVGANPPAFRAPPQTVSTP